jgi:predicted phosphoribosyltransferase
MYGSTYLDTSTIQSLKISNEYIESEKFEQQEEIERRTALYSPQPKEYNIKDRTVILVDDGIATGATIIAAARWIRKHEPKRLIIAAPVAPKELVSLKNEGDEFKFITTPSSSRFKSVELYYQDFSPLTDSQIIQIMTRRNPL